MGEDGSCFSIESSGVGGCVSLEPSGVDGVVVVSV